MAIRSYTNRDGESIELSQEHLDTAVRIKKELQLASPSHKCSWAKHKKMMEEEGFFDSENSERYRILIKNYQKSIGELPEATKYADMVTTSKLESIKQAVGDMAYSKREVQIESRKLNKLQRDLTLYGVIAEEVRDAMINELGTYIPEWTYEIKLPTSPKRMVVLLSDLHVGAVVVNVNGNSFNYVIAKKRMKKFLHKVVETAKLYGITDIDVVALGDATEHIQMRKSQGYSTEFPLAIQMIKAFELIRDFLVNLTKDFNVTYRGISGNHDRMEGKKDDNVDGDSTMVVINHMVKEFVENTKAPRLEYYESDNILYSTVLDINGALIKFVHGDLEGRGNDTLSKHSQMDGVDYTAIVMGHLHHFSVKEVGVNKWQIHFGSIKGIDNYAKKGKFGSSASQGVIIVHEDGELEPKSFNLQNY